MKQLFLFVLSAGLLAACNNTGSSAANDIKDSVDSITNLKKESVDNAAEQAKDTMQKNADSLKKMIDSTAKKASDSLHKSK